MDINQIDNQISYMNGIIKGYYLGIKKSKLNIKSLISKINELKMERDNLDKNEINTNILEKKTNEETKYSNIQKTNDMENKISTQEISNENNKINVLDLEITPENVLSLENQKKELTEEVNKLENLIKILKRKSRTMKLSNKKKLKMIVDNYTEQIMINRNKLFEINNFFEKNNIDEKKNIWELVKHAEIIIEFISNNKIKYSNDPLFFKSIILTMYKKNFNMVDLKGNFLNIKKILDLNFTLVNEKLNDYKFSFLKNEDGLNEIYYEKKK